MKTAEQLLDAMKQWRSRFSGLTRGHSTLKRMADWSIKLKQRKDKNLHEILLK